MAEGWLRFYSADVGLDAEIHSAGIEATQVQANAITVMQEVGIDIAHHVSKTLDDVPDPWSFDVVMTVCDSANESCPAYPASTSRLHVPFPGPSGQDFTRWRTVRDAIGTVSRRLIHALVSGRIPTAAEIQPFPMRP